MAFIKTFSIWEASFINGNSVFVCALHHQTYQVETQLSSRNGTECRFHPFFFVITIYSFFVCSFLKALTERRKGNKADKGVIMMIRIISVLAQVLKFFSSDCGDTAASKWNNKYSSR